MPKMVTPAGEMEVQVSNWKLSITPS